MCSITVKVNEEILRRVNPNLNSTAAISQWVQQLVDLHTQEMTEFIDDEYMDIETARNIVLEAVREEYARP